MSVLLAISPQYIVTFISPSNAIPFFYVDVVIVIHLVHDHDLGAFLFQQRLGDMASNKPSGSWSDQYYVPSAVAEKMYQALLD